MSIYSIFTLPIYRLVLIVMLVLAVFVFIALQHFRAGYGYLRNSKWGLEINNKVGWMIMEAPVFICMLWLFIYTKSYTNVAVTVMTMLFLVHYFQRSFIFPLLIRGNSTIPVTIVIMSIIHNLVNVYMQGGWLFFPTVIKPQPYQTSWLWDPRFIIGTFIFLFGFYANLKSDYIVRHLRKSGDTRHYIPMGGMFKYVSSANYFGELVEWFGFAVLTWSPSGLVFFLFTFANLVPRSSALYDKYVEEFGDDFTKLHRKKCIPFIY